MTLLAPHHTAWDAANNVVDVRHDCSVPRLQLTRVLVRTFAPQHGAAQHADARFAGWEASLAPLG